jgi:hypothetical protein
MMVRSHECLFRDLGRNILPKKGYDMDMKTTQSILETLTGQPQFRSLTRHRCYRQFLAMLPLRFRDAIGFVYVREGTLHVALRHPGYKMELNYNKDLLKNLLDSLSEHNPSCAQLRAQNVVLFVSKYTTAFSDKKNEATVPYYYELSEGTFEDHSNDPDLHRQFERLRATIHANRQRDA